MLKFEAQAIMVEIRSTRKIVILKYVAARIVIRNLRFISNFLFIWRKINLSI